MSYYIAVEFIFIPSPNIGVNQLAHYRCSVDHTGVGITWFVNETTSDYLEVTQLGVVTSGESQESNLTIPGYPQYNNTIVRCLASGFVDGILYNNFDSVTLRIQGNTLSGICHIFSY